MKVGDKVRFLSEVGGGIVSGFQGKDLVLVQDEDGFDIPMLKNQVVVIDTDDYNIAKVNTINHKKKQIEVTEVEIEPCDKPITFKPKATERKEGDKLNLHLSFVPNDMKDFKNTTFEIYLVNDCNYHLQVLCANPYGEKWNTRFCGIVEPNSKAYIEDISRTDLNEISTLRVQCIAWKEDKPYEMKEPCSIQLHIDGVKFYKAHLFQSNLFFSDPNLTFDLVKEDKPLHSIESNIKKLQMEWHGHPHEEKATTNPVKDLKRSPKDNLKKSNLIEVDLHIEELIDSTTGMSNGDILMLQMKTFREIMDKHLSKKGFQIVFIHGKGDGVLRKNILQELKFRYKSCSWQDASFREYGYGATQVWIK